MEIKPTGQLILDESREGYAVFGLHECVAYLDGVKGRKTKQSGRIYDKVASVNRGRDVLSYIPVELSKRESKRLANISAFVCEHAETVLAKAGAYDAESKARSEQYGFNVSDYRNSYSEYAEQWLGEVRFLQDRLTEVS